MAERLQIPDDAVPLHDETIPVRWGDMDAFGHVNSILYFQYFEQARAGWLTQRTLADVLAGAAPTGPVVASAACDFLRPVVWPATLRVRMYGGDPGQRSFQTWYRVEDGDETDVCYALGQCAIVWVDYSSGKSVSVPANIMAPLSGEAV